MAFQTDGFRASAPTVLPSLSIIDGSFVNSYDTALWVAPATRTNPTNNFQGLYVQARVAGDLGGFVHDAAALELRLSGASNGGAAQNAVEASLVVTGGVNSIASANGVVSNFHTEGTPTGTFTSVALFRASTIPALAGGFAITTAYSAYLEAQTVGGTNWTLYAPLGNSKIGDVIVQAGTSVKSINVPILIRNSGDTGTFISMETGGFRWNDAGLQQTTVGAAGAASVLPAFPTKYLKVKDNAGTTLVIPAYNP